ncbi:hypothetical protein SAMN05660874_03962 [Saccharopolyspora flava]|uniref:Uncharacterized protein n=1 Tax=Saccharopolyspora flava TaxID=95161 RepID=A0A1I6TIG4_9PSEU|nr:hypothetical protein SAMN05660874_03962 [Saccharopolyspora flava]
MTADGRKADPVTVRVPDELPVLTQEASRILLAVLIELTEVEALERPLDEGNT